MDKDSERERKHQQQQNERQQEIVIATGGSVDEHFEESLRRAKEKVSDLFVRVVCQSN